MFDIITIGTATKDIFLRSKKIKVRDDIHFISGKSMAFEAGSKVEIDEIITTIGGGATNSATTFSRLGFKTATCFNIGKDLVGREIKQFLKKERVKTRFIINDKKRPTNLSVILLEPQGERVVFVHRGAVIKSYQLRIRDLNTKWIYLSSVNGNLKMLGKIASYAREKNIKLAFNPGSKEIKLGLKKLFPILDITTILILNRAEASSLMNLPYKSGKTIVRQSCKLTPGIEIITDGQNGADVVYEGELYSIGIYDWPLIDRLGAGDAFGSGFVGAYIKYKDIKKALQYAAANASSVVTKVGTKAGIIRNFPKEPLKVKIKEI
jgi:sugar/nucleoside kinase (ribokinase family)